MTKRVLVAGGAGFLGSHLCDRLLAEGCFVICLDDLSSGRLSNLAHLEREPRFVFVRKDVRQLPHDVAFDVDWIFNLACPASPPAYQLDPIGSMLTSVVGAYNLLELGRREGARLLQASTSEVYGDPEISPQPEGYRGRVSTTGPRACYDEGKRAAETLFYDYRRQHDLDVRVARIFNTYGPRMSPDDGRVVSNFLCQALRGEPLTIYGDGSQTRSFCYVSDLIDGLFRLMALDRLVEAPVNIGNPHEVTMLELVAHVRDIATTPVSIERRDLPTDDPMQRKPDITQARRLLQWAPTIDLMEGLRLTMASLAADIEKVREGDGKHARIVERPIGSPIDLPFEDDISPLPKAAAGPS